MAHHKGKPENVVTLLPATMPPEIMRLLIFDQHINVRLKNAKTLQFGQTCLDQSRADTEPTLLL